MGCLDFKWVLVGLGLGSACVWGGLGALTLGGF